MRILARTLLAVAVAGLATSACSNAVVHRSINAAEVAPGTSGFSPGVIRVHRDDKVAIKLGNTTARTHGFTIVDQNVQTTVDAGKTVSVKFVPRTAGTFRIYCQLHPAHRPAELVVT
jgi:plastocyanin